MDRPETPTTNLEQLIDSPEQDQDRIVEKLMSLLEGEEK